VGAMSEVGKPGPARGHRRGPQSPCRGTCLVRAPLDQRLHRAQFTALGRSLAGMGMSLFGVYDAPPGASRAWHVEQGVVLCSAALRPMLTRVEPLVSREGALASSYRDLLQHARMRDALDFDEVVGTFAGDALTRADRTRRACLYLDFWAVLLHVVRPQVTLVWNGWSVENAALALMARCLGSEVLFVERGPLPETLQVDPDGVNGGSAFAAQPFRSEASTLSPEAEQAVAAYARRLRRGGESAWEQPARQATSTLRARLGIPPTGRVVFFPGQVTSDTNLVLLSPHFKSNAEVMQFLGEVLRDHQDWWLVVKPHPKAVDRIEAPDALGRRCVICTDVHVHDLIEIADLVVTINSSVGVESVLFGKPVLQLGRGLMSNKGVVYEPAGRREAETAIAKLLMGNAEPIAEARRKSFMHQLIFEFLYRFDSDGLDLASQRLAERICALAAQASFEPAAAEAFAALCELFSADVTRATLISMFSTRELMGTVKRRLLGWLRGKG